MKRSRLAAALGAVSLAVMLTDTAAVAQTLEAALAAAYETNSQLDAQRARVRATDEQVPQALSGYRPTLQTFSQIGPLYQYSNNKSLVGKENNALFSRTFGASIEQPLFRGGQTVAAVRSAENTVRAERARLEITEQQVLLNAATAYSDVYRDQTVLEVNIRNEQRLAHQLEATRDRFQVGEVTRTDVSQSEARLARATADRITAEGNLAVSRATFRNVVGMAPGILQRPFVPRDLPASLGDANRIANDENPNVTSAAFLERSTLDSADQVRGELWPTVSLIGRLQRQEDLSRKNSQLDSVEGLVNLTVPLYQAGSVYSRLRERKQLASEQRKLLEQAQHDAVESATRAWNDLETAQAAIGSFAKQVEANQLALEGVQKEAEVGARTVLEVLDAEQELLDAQVSLAQSQRNQVVAAYQLKSALGVLTARRLGLPVQYYDPGQHYREVRDEWLGGSSTGDVSSDFNRTRDLK